MSLASPRRQLQMLKDRIVDFSETKEEEWTLLRSKIGNGIELYLPAPSQKYIPKCVL